MEKKVKFYERALISCVLMLIICIGFKLFGANWFDLETNIPILNKLNNLIINNEILSFIYSFILTFISSILMIGIVTKVENNKAIILTSLLVLIAMFSDKYINIPIICVMIDIVTLYIICLILNKHCTLNFIICCIINIVYQLLSIMLRNIYIDINYYNVVILTLMNIDYYMLLAITYLYIKKGDKTLCGVLDVCFSSQAKKLWKKRTLNLKQSSNKGGCENE